MSSPDYTGIFTFWQFMELYTCVHFLVSTLQLNKHVFLVFPSPLSIFLSFIYFFLLKLLTPDVASGTGSCLENRRSGLQSWYTLVLIYCLTLDNSLNLVFFFFYLLNEKVIYLLCLHYKLITELNKIINVKVLENLIACMLDCSTQKSMLSVTLCFFRYSRQEFAKICEVGPDSKENASMWITQI